MSFPPRSPLPAVCASVLLICGLTLGQPPAASGDPGSAPVQQLTPKTSQPRTVDLGGDSRAIISGGPDHQVRALPDDAGRRPGLLLGDGPTGTTLQTPASRQRPQTLRGGAVPAPKTADDDLVEVRFDAIGRDGRQAPAHVSIFDVESGAVEAARPLPGDSSATCSSAEWADSNCILVPPGTYSMMAFVSTQPAGEPSTVKGHSTQSVALVGDPERVVDGDDSITFDARRAKPIEVSTPGNRTDINAGGAVQFGYTRTAADGTPMRRDLNPGALLEHTFYLQPTDAVRIGELGTFSRVRLAAPDIEINAPGLRLEPEYYRAAWFSDLDRNFPTFDGRSRVRVADVGHAAENDLAGLDLNGAIAVAERTDELSVAEQSNAAADAGAELVIIHNDGPGDNADPNGTGVRLQVPTLRLSRMDGTALKQRDEVVVRGEHASPYLYDLVITEDGKIPEDLSYRYPRSELSTQLRTFHGQPSIPSTYSETAYQYQPGDEFSISTMFPLRDGPRTRVEYRIPDPDTRWTYAMATPESRYNALFPHPPLLPMLISNPEISAYRPHRVVAEPIGIAPITAAPALPIQRSGDQLRVSINAFSDAAGNRGRGYSSDSGMKTLLQVHADDELIAETEHLPDGVVALPSGESKVAISFSTENPQDWTQLSTSTDVRWTFPSSSTPGNEISTAPIILADYDVDLDQRNRMRQQQGQPATVDVQLTRQPGADSAPITGVSLDVSYDGGQTWKPAEIRSAGSGYRATLPPGQGNASLRLQATDRAGSTLEQTTIDAFARTG